MTNVPDEIGQTWSSRRLAKDALVDATVELARSRFTGVPPDRAEALLRQYFFRVSARDLAGREPADLYAAAVRHWQLAERRQPGQTLVHVYDPELGVDGWQSAHTTIDVVTDDMPFVVDSLLGLMARQDLLVHFLAHPIAVIDRDDEGQIQGFFRAADLVADGLRESFVHLEVDRVAGADRAQLETEIRNVLDDVRDAVNDWQPMVERARAIAAEMEGHERSPTTDVNGWTEAPNLLRFLADEHFIFIGYRNYDFVSDPEVGSRLSSVPGSGLGVLRNTAESVRDLGEISPDIARLAAMPSVLHVTKTNRVSTVHRNVPLDYVGIKRFSPDGTVIGEHRFLGLFTASVYTHSVLEIPVIGPKAQAVIERAAFLPDTHDANHLLTVLETYPRDELFQITVDELHDFALGIVDLRDRRAVSLFVRRDVFGRFLSCLVYVPRDRYDTDTRLAIQRILMEAYDGRRCSFSTEVTGAANARVHFVIHTETDTGPLPPAAVVEDRLQRVIRIWDDELVAALEAQLGAEPARELAGRYAPALPPPYRNDVMPTTAVADLAQFEQLGPDDLAVKLWRPLEARGDEVRLKLYRSGGPLTLSAVIPLLHDLGADVSDERPYEIRVPDEPTRWIYDLGLRVPGDHEHRLGQAADVTHRFEEAFTAAWRGDAETDGFARLVAVAGLHWTDVVVLRAYARYLRQIGTTFTPSYVEESLWNNSRIVQLLVDLFRTRFDPSLADHDTSAIHDEIVEGIDAVASLDADRILRSFLTMIEATTRTNHYQRDQDGKRRPTLVFKFDPRRLPDLPAPVPAHEIFVYSPRVEGVHLRSAKVARGGIRASDRREDFRTEILGLAKAQSVKNAVIVPNGAKGGFVLKHPPSDPAAAKAEVLACYELFIDGLLDVTDNLVDGAAVPPPLTVRHDDDDTYLVVAADKGTASFSDTANEIAIRRGFWLGDAFASGGSVGYDHKKMAITARGAWESVRQHFGELGVDVDNDPISVVGIGDMSGDVFGNGMLLSPHLRLIAAFDHRHVFLDPDPDPARSFAERRRMFELPGSSWADYDTSVLSPGGGVFARTAKSVTLTPQIQRALGTELDAVTPTELIRLVLQAPVDLLWNGGIGTYVRASNERAEDIGDRSNDAVRVTAAQLRCRVIGEGGNLGLSARARVEYALAGGKVNADAIDNSGGVNCSDREVNLKILLAPAVTNGDLTSKQRDALLLSMADEVAALVLADNRAQAEALSAARQQAPGMVDVHVRHLDWLETTNGLNRMLEGLPSDAELANRHSAGIGLTQPELAVLLAHTKNAIAAVLVDSDLPDDPAFETDLLEYFPGAVRESFADAARSHPLRRELVATIMANQMVNTAGITSAHRLAEETSASFADIARAHVAAWRIHDLDRLWSEVTGLGPAVPAELRTALLLDLKRLGERATRWLLRHAALPPDIDRIVDRLRRPVATLVHLLPGMLVGADHEAHQAVLDDLIAHHVPDQLAREVAGLNLAFGTLDLADIAENSDVPLDQVARVYFLLDDELELSWLRDHIIGLDRDDRWYSRARSALRDDFFREHAAITADVVRGADPSDDPKAMVTNWRAANLSAFERCTHMFADLRSTPGQDLARASVALRELRHLSQQRR